MPDDIDNDDDAREVGDCPECGARDWQELSYRGTWQGVTLDEKGEPDDYESFDYGDDVWVNGVECRACSNVWPSYAELHKAMRGEVAKTGYMPESELFPGQPFAIGFSESTDSDSYAYVLDRLRGISVRVTMRDGSACEGYIEVAASDALAIVQGDVETFVTGEYPWSQIAGVTYL